MSRCEKCNKESDYLHAVYVCSACMSEVGVSQSRSSGGSSAAGTGQRAHSSDGCNLSQARRESEKRFEVDGEVYSIPEPIYAYIENLIKTLRYTMEKNDEACHVLSGVTDNLRDAFLGLGVDS